jgi:DNA-binding response OmpR family regulator
MAARILIAEDDESILASLDFLMRRHGYRVRLARDGREAISAAFDFLPDLVLLDIMMPLNSGLDACAAIRGNPKLRDTRILILTARGGAGEVSRGMAAGADDYLIKPFSTHDLVARVRQLIESASERPGIG